MKKLLVAFVFSLLLLSAVPVWSNSITINDPIGDQIGARNFDTKSLTYTVNELFQFSIETNTPQIPVTVGSWDTVMADLFLVGAKSGLFAIPLISHDGFNAGSLYQVSSAYTSDDREPAGGGYDYNHNIPVLIKEGTYTGYDGSLSWMWGTDTDYLISYVANGWLWDENNPVGDTLKVLWGTRDCANDVVTNTTSVPEPASMALLLCGLFGLGAIGRKKIVPKSVGA